MKRHHPAVFSDNVLNYVVRHHLVPHGLVLDPFCGIGRIHQLDNPLRMTVGVEIEWPWASARRNNIRGNARHLPFRDETFHGAFTSPAYGNRLADHHNAADGSVRRSYTHDLRRTVGDNTRNLHPDNSGTLAESNPAYWELHEAAWRELYRVLKAGGTFVLNVSDFVRRGKTVPVVARHRELCQGIGFNVTKSFEVETPRMRYGENREARVPTESLLVFRK